MINIKKLVKALGLILAPGILSVACAAPADDPALDDTKDDVRREANAIVTTDNGVTPRRMAADDGSCGERCSISCAGGSCSISGPKGGTVCCVCDGTRPSCT